MCQCPPDTCHSARRSIVFCDVCWIQCFVQYVYLTWKFSDFLIFNNSFGMFAHQDYSSIGTREMSIIIIFPSFIKIIGAFCILFVFRWPHLWCIFIQVRGTFRSWIIVAGNRPTCNILCTLQAAFCSVPSSVYRTYWTLTFWIDRNFLNVFFTLSFLPRGKFLLQRKFESFTTVLFFILESVSQIIFEFIMHITKHAFCVCFKMTI